MVKDVTNLKSIKHKNKIRVNITLDRDNLEKVKKKLSLYGGKLSTLFNLYLRDFVASMDNEISDVNKEMSSKIKELELRLKKLEGK
jgi:hypothetical protein